MMPAPAPYSSPHSQPLYPALYLYPLNDSFVPKHISLVHNQRVKIGRQTNAKTVPGERNGYFDSKVLSRQHAEVWEEGNKIYIKDVKSSNGTFINGDRLSAEGLESDPWELKNDDIVEFGIDIVGEDNKTIVHHKVAARVLCVFSDQDVQVASRAEAHQANAGSSSMLGGPSQAGPSNPGATNPFNFAAGQGGPASAQRRLPMQQQGLGGMGGMGASMRAPGKSGLTFDHILSRLQGELQKSRETGAELHSLTGAMNEIHDTLGGSLPANLPPYPQSLPPVRLSSSSPDQQQQRQTSQSSSSTSALSELQSQLQDTQSSLASHVDKIRALEGVLAEHEAMKREVSSLREMMEERKREMEQRETAVEHPMDDDDDDDDARSIITVVPHELERVEEEDEDQLTEEDREREEDEDDRRRRREELGRPRTPEPTGMGMNMREHNYNAAHTRSPSPPTNLPEELSPQQSPLRPRSSTARAPLSPSVSVSMIDQLTQRLSTLSDQLESALSLSTSLQAQHTAAQHTISALETKVSALESMVQATQTQVEAAATVRPASPDPERRRDSEKEREKERESMTEMLNEWKKGVEGQWSNVQEEWSQERERLNRAREEWESRARIVEAGLGSAVSRVDSSLASLAAAAIALQTQHRVPNGDAKVNGIGSSSGGLVTPPSPRSLSSDSNRPRQRRRRAGSSRGRSRSGSPGTTVVEDFLSSAEEGSDNLPNGVHGSKSYHRSGSRKRYSHGVGDTESRDELVTDEEVGMGKDADQRSIGLPTPESSVHQVPSSDEGDRMVDRGISILKGNENIRHVFDMHGMNASTAVGVLVLSVAAAAVIWRVKPE